MIEIYEQGLTFDREVWEGAPGRCVVVDFRDDDVRALTHGRLRSLELQTRHEVFDERVSRLALEIGEKRSAATESAALGPLHRAARHPVGALLWTSAGRAA
jgi:hypothetical protein